MNKKLYWIQALILCACVLAGPRIVRSQTDKNIQPDKLAKYRTGFTQMISANPNYFGNIKDSLIAVQYKPVYPMQGNTTYEELICTGLYPEQDLLESVIEVKLPYGFGTGLCGTGTKEFVGYYLDDGTGFVSLGAPTEVDVHNIAFVDGSHLFYAVRKAFSPAKFLNCKTPQIVKIRSILSWEQPPSGPNSIPVWGNIEDRWVQIRPVKKAFMFYPMPYDPFVIPKLAADPIPLFFPKDIQSPVGLNPVEPICIAGTKEEIKEFIDQSIEAENRMRQNGQIEKERFDYVKQIAKNPNSFGSISESKEKTQIMKMLNQMPTSTMNQLKAQIAVNPEFLAPLYPYLLKTRYEQMTCVGLYPEEDLLEAVIQIKLNYGFSGDLCTAGSQEYVAFYIDWGTGYEHMATASVNVHDIPDVANAKNLYYAVKANIPADKLHLKSCSTENIVKVKAILSWNMNPTPYGPNFTPTWGNTLVKYVQIRPESSAGQKCYIEIINEIVTDDIGKTGADKGYAVKTNSAGNMVFGTYDRPFGGVIACWGKYIASAPGAVYYRFLYKEDAAGSVWKPVLDNRITRRPLLFWPYSATVSVTPDADGWFLISEYENDKNNNYSLAAMLHWITSGKSGRHILRMELGDAVKNPIAGQYHEVPVFLDNEAPKLLTFGGTPPLFPLSGVAVKDLGGAYKKCDMFTGAGPILIFGNFTDNHFNAYSLTFFGGNLPSSGAGIGSGRYDSGLAFLDQTGIAGAFNGGPGALMKTFNPCPITQTPAKVKCAYGIRLEISDRTIVGALSGYAFDTYSYSNAAYVTFDWDPTGCP